MERKLDCIRFESRREIAEVLQILEDWQKLHSSGNAEQLATVRQLQEQLEIMFMEW